MTKMEEKRAVINLSSLFFMCINILLFFILCFAVLHYYFFYYKHPMRDLYTRKVQIENWYDRVLDYKNRKGELPTSLFELCKDRQDFLEYLKIGKDGTLCRNETLFSDPNLFYQISDYELYKSSQGWFIKELRKGKDYDYKNLLLIDENKSVKALFDVP